MIIRHLGLQEYEPILQAMQAFTDQRHERTHDELWLLEHPPVFTLGLNGKPEHLLNPGNIPIIKIDRGGQVTYHGPGQLVIYCLLNIKRNKIGVRELVTTLENSVIELLNRHNITALARRDAPGVYVDDAKIAALGLRVRRGCCYHGLALNVSVNLEPFSRINPCGYANLAVTRTKDLGMQETVSELAPELAEILASNLNYNVVSHAHALPELNPVET